LLFLEPKPLLHSRCQGRVAVIVRVALVTALFVAEEWALGMLRW